MTENQAAIETENESAEPLTDLVVGINAELNDDGKVMIKYAFFNQYFALAVRVPIDAAIKMVDGMATRTREIVFDQRKGERESESRIQPMKGIPSALQSKANGKRMGRG